MNKTSAPQRALFVRMDRIGDLTLTLPADLHPYFQGMQTHWYISKGLGFVPEHAVPARAYTEWKREFSWSQFWRFFLAVRQWAPAVSISFHSPWWVTFALWLARVPQRVGVLSSWHSFLFLNRGLRQKRSRCELHELDYNHQLIQKTLAPQSPPCTDTLQLKAQEALRPISGDYFVVHPGMAGSALNWPLASYKKLIENLLLKSQVVITGTATDRSILEPLAAQLPQHPRLIWLNEKLSPQELLCVLEKAQAVFAPSTGVVHLAASLGVPTRAIYSPVTVQQAGRWGPRGRNVKTWAPQVQCPAHFRCLGDACIHFDCMKLVSPQEISDNLLEQVKA